MAPYLATDREVPCSHVVLGFVGYEELAVFETPALRKATPTILKQHKVPGWSSLLLEAPPAE